MIPLRVQPRKKRCLLAILFPLLASLFVSCGTKEAHELLKPPQALGVVAAEEAERLAGPKKQIVILVPDASWGPASTVEVALRATLKKHGFTAVSARPPNLGDPMKAGEVGLPASAFLETIESSRDAGAIVSLAGAPLFKPGEALKAGAEHPPVLVIAVLAMGNVPGIPGDRLKLAQLLESKTISTAIIDGPDAARTAAKQDATHELFANNFRFLRRPE